MPSERVQRQIDRLLDECEEAVRQMNWALVQERAQAVLDLDPDSADAQEFLAAAQRAQVRLDGGQPAHVLGSSAQPDMGDGRGETAQQPTAFANGRYEVKRFLGEGGKKRVFLAHDSLLDRDVAFALIKTEGLDEVGRERVRREAQAMGRLGAHPHIVSVFDLGEHEGQPYMVTELMGGGDVEGLLEKAEGHRLSLELALRIADEVCQGLAFAHQQQLVHRDLKPGNVWLTADGTAKIGDFGLAVATDRVRLTQSGLMVGTALYMPPEQVMGGEPSPQADLYSLGAMLYEMVTGRPPFVGDEPVAIITQHLNTPPVAPSWHVPDLPTGLEVLILRLLEKDSTKRPATASEVLQILGEIARTPTPAERDLPPRVPTEGGSDGRTDNPLYRRTFVGRETELKQLYGAFDRALSGEGSLVAVVGEAGIGKTALCEQISTYVAMRGGKTLVGHSYEEGTLSLPYLPFIEALRSYVLARDPEGLRQDLGSGAAEVARLVSEVRDRLPTADIGGQTASGPDADRWRLYQALVGFLRNASQVQPMLVILEDLHWADRATLDLLVFLARQLSGARLLIVGNYRDVEVDRTHQLSGTLAELRRGSAFLRLPLRGLTADEVQRMLSAIAGQEVSWGLSEAVHRQTEGNPLFVQEVLRYLAEQGLVERAAGHWPRTGATPLELQIPEGLRDVIGKRLSRLSQACNQVLATAAVIGRDFELRTLQAVSGQEEEPLAAALEEALHVGVLEDRSRPGLLRYRFAHAFFRQTLYEELFSARRLRLHQQIARALEHQYASRLTEHAAELAEHFAQSTDAEDLGKAVRYGQLAAQRALAVYAYGEAARLLEQALQAQEVLDPDDAATRCDLLLALSEALAPAGEPLRAAEDVAPQALALAEGLADRGRAFRVCQAALVAYTRYGGATIFARAAVQRWANTAGRYAAPGTAEEALATASQGMALEGSERRADAWSLYLRAVDVARRLNDPAVFTVAITRIMAGTASGPEDEPIRQKISEEWLTLPREKTLARFGATIVLHYGGIIRLANGDRAGAEALFSEIDQLAERTRDPEALIRSFYELVLLATIDGELEKAIALSTTLEHRAVALGMDVFGQQQARNGMLRPRIYLGQASQILEDTRAVNPLVPSIHRLLALAHADRPAEAQAAVAERYVDNGHRAAGSGVTTAELVALLELVVALGDSEAAATVGRRLESLRGQFTATSFNFTAIARHLGGAAALQNQRALARAYYDEALEVAGRIRHRPEAALTNLSLAELSLTGTPSERAEAQTHLDVAIEEFRAMKMQPSLERALSHKGLLKA